VNAAFLFLHTV